MRMQKKIIRPGEPAEKKAAAGKLSYRILGQNSENLFSFCIPIFLQQFFIYQTFLSLQKTLTPEVVQQLLLSHVRLLPALGEIDIGHSSRIVQLIEYDSLSRRRIFGDG